MQINEPLGSEFLKEQLCKYQFRGAIETQLTYNEQYLCEN